jgi:hypothetical protein
MLAERPSETKVTVNKEVLLVTLKTNREAHIKDYEEAMQGYLLKRLFDLEEATRAATTATTSTVHELPSTLSWNVPESHVKDYDRAIRMVEMSVETQIILSGTSFDNLVMDEWDWKRRADLLNSSYKSFADAIGASR